MTDKEMLTTETPVQHSPGPWTCFYKHKYNEWHVGVPVSSGSMKLTLFPDGCPTENPEADCHLIAAAPDLLASLKTVREWMDNPAINPECPLSVSAASAIRIAIAKAEGK